MGGGAAENVACGRGVGAGFQCGHIEIVEPRQLGQKRGRQAARESGAVRGLAQHLEIGDRDGAFHHPGGRRRRLGDLAAGEVRPDEIGKAQQSEAEPDQRRDPEAHDIAVGARRRRRSGRRGFAFGGLVRLGLGRLLDRAPAAEGRDIGAARQLDHHRIAVPRALVVLRQRPAQPARLHPHDGVARLVEIVRPSENVHGDRIALEGRRPAFERLGHDMAQKIAEPRRLRELRTVQDALQSAPRLVGRHFAAARQPSVPKTAD